MTPPCQMNDPTDNPDFDFKSVFHAADYLYFYENHLQDAYTNEEIQFLINKIPLDRPKRILDLACGHGRHTNQLARLGHYVTGVDNNEDFLNIARENAEKSKLKVTYICEDSRRYSSPGAYDCIIHLFSSFGYFPDEQNEQVLQNIASSLRPGGVFCLDILNRDAFLKDFPICSVLEKNEDLMIDRNRFDPLSGRLYNTRIIIRDGKRKDTPFFLRLYNPTEILQCMRKAGLFVINLFGDWKGNSFHYHSKRLILIAEKPDDTS